MGTAFRPASVTNPSPAQTSASEAASYAPGTAIATEAGETPIEVLAIGDIVRTASGMLRPVKWIGQRRYASDCLAANPHLLPIRVLAGALGDGLPRRELLLSPKNAVLIDGALVPAGHLVNDTTIIQDTSITSLTYVQIELETHDIILAEGVPAETFAADSNQAAPRLTAGGALDSIRRRLAALALAGSPLDGVIERVEAGRVSGWARDPNALGTPVRLVVTDHGETLGEVVARQYRADLAAPGVSHGCHGFDFTVPGGLSPAVRHSIAVRRVTDGRPLLCSPYLIEAQTTPPAPAGPPALLGQLDTATRTRITGWAQDAGSPAPVMLAILDNGVTLARVLANRFRMDLQAAGIGAGQHGFDLAIPGGLSPLERHVIEVHREADGAPLPFSPIVIDAASRFDGPLEQALAAAVDKLAPADTPRMLAFLMAQAERVLQRSAHADGNHAARQAWLGYRRRNPTEDTGDAAAPPNPGLRALVIGARLPVAGRDAASAALLSHMAALQQLGYEVSLVLADDMTAASPALTAAGIKLCTVPLYAAVEEVLQRQADCFDILYLRQADIAARYLHLARRHQPRARILLSLPDLPHRRLERRADRDGDPGLREASQRLRTIERHAAWSADAVLTPSAEEAALLRRAVPAAQIHCVPWQVPPLSGRPAFAQRQGVAFIGHYGHSANIDAAFWLAETIMPLVWAQLPGLECILAGSAMPASIRNLARPGITALGYVDDSAAVFNRVRVTIAPMREGAGICGKMLDSLAAGVPCILTPLAAEGLDLPPPLTAMVAADAAGLAARICAYHEDRDANRKAARAGLAMIREHWSGAAVTAGLQAAITGQPIGCNPVSIAPQNASRSKAPA